MAAEYFGKSQATIRSWVLRYNVRRFGTHKGRIVYDFADLSTIDAHLFRGDPVPKTPELRDAYRAALRQAA